MLQTSIRNTMQTPFGAFCFEHDYSAVTSAYFCGGTLTQHKRDAFSQTVLGLLNDYFYKKDRTALDKIAINPVGSLFQLRVWEELRVMAYGETQYYGAVARRLKTAAQAVGQACRSNPIVVIIPCHRIIAQTGVGGYMGQARAVALKVRLLEHETVLPQRRTI